MMTDYSHELTLDFGEVGYRHEKYPLRVRLEANRLEDLIRDAENAHRVYELTLIERPGDVWDYVLVVPEAVPPGLTESIERARETHAPGYCSRHPGLYLGLPHPWPEGKLPFPVFDRMFHWTGDDTDPLSEAWLSERESQVMNGYADSLLAIVRAGMAQLNRNDPLLRHELALARANKHAYTYLDRASAIDAAHQHPPNEPLHSAGFYRKLSQLLREPDIVSVAYRGEGDYQVLRILCTEQRHRADNTDRGAPHALQLSALTNRHANTAPWTAHVDFYDVGLAHGDLFIEESNNFGRGIRWLIEHWDTRSSVVLCQDSAGEIAGYTRESGEGWTLYRRKVRQSRRRDGAEHQRTQSISRSDASVRRPGRNGV